MANAAYVVVEPGPPGRCIVALVVEGDDGYRPVRDYEAGPRDEIEGIVARLNARLGVTPRQANKIALATMKTVSRPFDENDTCVHGVRATGPICVKCIDAGLAPAIAGLHRKAKRR